MENYDILVLDEAQRIFITQLKLIISFVKDEKKAFICGYDAGQMLSKKEQDRNAPAEIDKIVGLNSYELTEKIRTNPEIADFIRLMMDNKKTVVTKSFPNVQILYADSYSEANTMIEFLKNAGYNYISYTSSNYVKGIINNISYSVVNTHSVIGHEYDNVLMVLTKDFQYNENQRLSARKHPNPDYLFDKLFYQGITRTRGKLAIIVVQNFRLFEYIMNLFDRK